MITDCHAMRVTPEVSEDGQGSAEGWLGVDDPVGLEERVDEGVPRGLVTQMLAAANEIELVPVVRPSERLDKLSPEEPTEDLHGQEEAGVLRGDPARVIG